MTRDELIQAILEGHEYIDFRRDTRFTGIALSDTQIRNIIEKFVHYEDGTSVKGITSARVELLRPFLKEAIAKGLDRDGVLNYLRGKGITIIDKLYTSLNRPFAGLHYFCELCFGKNFDQVREDFFIRPLVDRLVRKGILITGIGSSKVTIKYFPDLIGRIKGRPVRNTQLGVGQELGLIEILISEGIMGIELTKALNLWKDGDSETVRRAATKMINTYIQHRWGLPNEFELKQLLVILALKQQGLLP